MGEYEKDLNKSDPQVSNLPRDTLGKVFPVNSHCPTFLWR